MRVLITGADGFIGKNLQLHLAIRQDTQVVRFTHSHEASQFPDLLEEIDFVFHLAGSNRPENPAEFISGNVVLTENLVKALTDIAKKTGKKIPVIFTSSTQSGNDSAYGKSKRIAEDALLKLSKEYEVPVYIFRLPNVFGKWCKPNYNSVVATFCYNIARGLPIKIDDPMAPLSLVYIDDVIKRFIQLMDGSGSTIDSDGFEILESHYKTTVGQLAWHIQTFKDSRSSLLSERVGVGFVRALYSTYISYLPTNSFAYSITRNNDIRGTFVEMLKTPDCGQFSYFTAQPGVTRGGHYHHTKTEKFLVVKGCALFRFRNMDSGETFEMRVDDKEAVIVETIPGWAHDITNIGSDEMIVMLWANEIFDRSNPDTYSCSL